MRPLLGNLGVREGELRRLKCCQPPSSESSCSLSSLGPSWACRRKAGGRQPGLVSSACASPEAVVTVTSALPREGPSKLCGAFQS